MSCGTPARPGLGSASRPGPTASSSTYATTVPPARSWKVTGSVAYTNGSALYDGDLDVEGTPDGFRLRAMLNR